VWPLASFRPPHLRSLSLPSLDRSGGSLRRSDTSATGDIADLSGEKRVEAVTGCTDRFPIAADAIEDEVQEAFAICGGDAIAVLRITLIANAFPEAVDRLSAAVSSSFAGGKVRKAPRPKGRCADC
jgi:hypothetical protein